VDVTLVGSSAEPGLGGEASACRSGVIGGSSEGPVELLDIELVKEENK
jgi:hypothetical protein